MLLMLPGIILVRNRVVPLLLVELHRPAQRCRKSAEVQPIDQSETMSQKQPCSKTAEEIHLMNMCPAVSQLEQARPNRQMRFN